DCARRLTRFRANGHRHWRRRRGATALGNRRHRRHSQLHLSDPHTAADIIRSIRKKEWPQLAGREGCPFRGTGPSLETGTFIQKSTRKEINMTGWFWYAIGAAVLYGLHQVFTKLAANRIGDGLGGFVVEITAALTILGYLAFLWFTGKWNQKASSTGVVYSVLTGICVGAGTVLFFLLFQKG